VGQPVIVVEYDPHWPELFAELRGRLIAVLGDLALSIEHVGSTSVPGLPAKPTIDIDVVVADQSVVPDAIAALARLGYVYEGDLGVTGREAFRNPPGVPKHHHHLYVCPADSPQLKAHLVFRDHLRTHPDAMRQYGEMKRALAGRFGEDRVGYTEAKSEFIAHVMTEATRPS
jgi:GrpB-like predicted nucleotidyltransferase (UPF0157 family)